jgi:trimeric autotransporter adhesin
MSRFTPGISLACLLVGCVFVSACSHSNPTTVIAEPVPASVDLCLSPSSTCAGGINQSLEVGQIQGFTATAMNNQGAIETETFSFQSSNPSALTIASNGTACAGTWNSLTNPQVCTPGPTGLAQITATAQGVSSPPVTVYVHQHITGVTISKVPNQPATLSTACFSKGAPSGPESAIYQAFAFNGTADITPSVGPFAWQAVLLAGQTISAVTLSSPPNGAPLNQEIATANAPGISLFFTSVGGTHSLPLQFETCPVESISIRALGNQATSFVVNTGTSTTLNATVTDSLGMNLVGVALTWSSTNPISVSASGATSTVYGSVGTVSASAIGGGAVIASCTPPACNRGFNPSLPIYPQEAISFTVRSTSNPASPTAYVTSTGCSTATAPCTPTIVPISRTSPAAAFAAGNPVSIPFAPNSILFDDRGSLAYLGVDSSAFGTKSLMTSTGTAASLVSNVAGKVLAVSPDATSVIVSDTADVPNQVFVCSNCSGSGSSVASLLITGATAAAFSPDSLQAYIVAGNNLYVYSKTDPLQTKSLTAPANDVAFFPEGAFAYLAGGASSAVTVRRTCDSALVDTVTTAATPSMIRALPDAATVVALEPPNSPNLELINVSPNGAWVGCTPLVNDVVSGTFNLGQGNFIPTQFIISPDGFAAYILGLQPPPNASLPFSFIIVFDFATQTPSLVSLAGNAVPLTASLSPAGDLLFVGANDGAVHVIDTASRTDTQQITFPYPSNALCYGPGTPATQSPVTCLPDLVAVRP